VFDGDAREAMHGEKPKPQNRMRPASVRSKTDTRHYSEPPAPPPQQPLPQKPEVAKALADPVIQPLLQRSDTARAFTPGNGSPTRADQSQVLLILTQELKLAKDQVPTLEERVKRLEEQLDAERIARATAEERASQLEQSSRKDSAHPVNGPPPTNDSRTVENSELTSTDLRSQIERLRSTMDEMKSQMEAYRQRAETAEAERDENRKTLAEMIEEKRKTNAREQRIMTSKEEKTEPRGDSALVAQHASANGHAVPPGKSDRIILDKLLARGGMDTSKPLSRQQAASLQQLLSKEMMHSENSSGISRPWDQLSYHGIPHACALSTVVLGLALMHYLNGFDKVQR